MVNFVSISSEKDKRCITTNDYDTLRRWQRSHLPTNLKTQFDGYLTQLTADERKLEAKLGFPTGSCKGITLLFIAMELADQRLTLRESYGNSPCGQAERKATLELRDAIASGTQASLSLKLINSYGSLGRYSECDFTGGPVVREYIQEKYWRTIEARVCFDPFSPNSNG